MSGATFNRKRAKLKKVLGIRTRLALLAVMLVAPLMFDRARSLEDTRTKQIALASEESSNLAQYTADAQREVVSSVETILKSAAYIRASAGGIVRSCDMMRASLPANLPWIRALLMVGGDGHVQSATNNELVGLDLSDRAYLRQARTNRDFVLSDFLLARPTNNTPIVMAAYPVAAINGEIDAVILAAVSLDWMARIMGKLGGRPGLSAVLIDSTGIVMAAPADGASMIGRPLDNIPLLSAIAERALTSDAPQGELSLAVDGSRRALSFARIPGTQSRLIVSIDEAKVTAAINREIRTAYFQLGFVCLFVLLGALVGAEQLIIHPIEVMTGMAKRFGEGDSSARVAKNRLPSEFVPRWRRGSVAASANWSRPMTVSP